MQSLTALFLDGLRYTVGSYECGNLTSLQDSDGVAPFPQMLVVPWGVRLAGFI